MFQQHYVLVSLIAVSYTHLDVYKRQELDFIFAKAQFGVLYHCCRPTIQKDGNVLSFLEARHPCIDQEKVIANDIILKQHRILLITGSNTGGKTVTLKTAGLLSFMALCGLPVSYTHLDVYKRQAYAGCCRCCLSKNATLRYRD